MSGRTGLPELGMAASVAPPSATTRANFGGCAERGVGLAAHRLPRKTTGVGQLSAANRAHCIEFPRAARGEPRIDGGDPAVLWDGPRESGAGASALSGPSELTPLQDHAPEARFLDTRALQIRLGPSFRTALPNRTHSRLAAFLEGPSPDLLESPQGAERPHAIRTRSRRFEPISKRSGAKSVQHRGLTPCLGALRFRRQGLASCVELGRRCKIHLAHCGCQARQSTATCSQGLQEWRALPTPTPPASHGTLAPPPSHGQRPA